MTKCTCEVTVLSYIAVLNVYTYVHVIEIYHVQYKERAILITPAIWIP